MSIKLGFFKSVLGLSFPIFNFVGKQYTGICESKMRCFSFPKVWKILLKEKFW